MLKGIIDRSPWVRHARSAARHNPVVSREYSKRVRTTRESNNKKQRARQASNDKATGASLVDRLPLLAENGAMDDFVPVPGGGGGRGGRGRGPPPPRFRGGGRGGAGSGRQQRWNNHRGGRGRGRGGRGRGGGGPRRAGGSRGFAAPLNDFIEEFNAESLQQQESPCITVAVEGCCHGELDAIYRRLRQHEEASGRKIDLLLCCGDFQSLRNLADFHSLAVPPKYRALGSFYRYYSGESVAPILTIFVGGNHEASQPLHELRYGGWVAPNIYYVGAAGVVSYRGVRIGGISGIYKSHDYRKGSFERPPFDRSTIRSAYHVRNVDVYRLKVLAASSAANAIDTAAETGITTSSNNQPIEIMLSHDWPQGIEQHGDTNALLRMKPFFRDEVQRNELGSPPNHELLQALQAKWWFAAHLHVKFRATVVHGRQQSKTEAGKPQSALDLVPSQTIGSPKAKAVDVTKKHPESAAANTNDKNATANNDSKDEDDGASGANKTTQFVGTESSDPCTGPDLTELMTRFLSLDKCLPRRQYLSIVHIPVKERESDAKLEYDPEWLAVLRKTHELTKVTEERAVLPPVEENLITPDDVEWVRQKLGPSLAIPENFERTAPAHAGAPFPLPHPLPPPLPMMGNPQTDRLLSCLELEHIATIPYSGPPTTTRMIDDKNEIGVGGGGDGDGDDDGVPKDENEIDLDNDDDQVDVAEDDQVDVAEDADDENEIDIDDDTGGEDELDRDTNGGDPTTKKPRIEEDS